MSNVHGSKQFVMLKLGVMRYPGEDGRGQKGKPH
jgi:hypothetical protein